MTHDTRRSCPEIQRSGRHSFVCVGAAIVLGSCLSPSTQAADEKAIAAVETYGLHRVARQSVLDTAGLREGAPAHDRTQRKAIIDRLQKIPGVRRAAIVVVVTPFPNPSGGTIGRPIVYIGIQESGRPDANFRTAPSGSVTLPPAIVTTYADSERAFLESIKHNDFSEDDSNGYALMGNEALRASQRKFVPLADQYYEQLVDVLQNSKDAEQRAIAATVIAYASNKKRIAKDLLIGTSDPNEGVRNDAVRALSVLLTYARAHRELGIEVSTDLVLGSLGIADLDRPQQGHGSSRRGDWRPRCRTARQASPKVLAVSHRNGPLEIGRPRDDGTVTRRQNRRPERRRNLESPRCGRSRKGDRPGPSIAGGRAEDEVEIVGIAALTLTAFSGSRPTAPGVPRSAGTSGPSRR